MSNVVTAVGALIAGVLGGSLFAAALVAQPRIAMQAPVAAPVVQMPPGMMTSPSGATLVMPPGYRPGVQMTSGDESKPAAPRLGRWLRPASAP
jgi:hypothetical protein